MSNVIKGGILPSDPQTYATFKLEVLNVPGDPGNTTADTDGEPAGAGGHDSAPDPEVVAREIVLRAEAQAREILDEARSHCAVIEEEARIKGLAKGRGEAAAQIREELDQLRERAEAMEREREEFYRAAEPELAQLSVEIARKVLKQEINQNPEAVIEVVRDTLRRVKEKDVRIRVNPEDAALVRSRRDSFTDFTGAAGDLEVLGDRRVGRGGCIVETPGGSLDARLDPQLDIIEGEFSRESLEGGDADGQPG